jgi:RHS repeat-associated protein
VSDAVIEQGSCMLAGQPTTYSKTINVAGKVLERWEDQHGRLVQSKDPSGQTTVFNYDVEGQLLTVSVGGNLLLTNTWDTFGNKISVTETNSGSSSSVYNAFGEVLSSTNAKGQTSTFTYDALGRPLTVNQPEGTYTTLYSEATGATRGKVIQITGSGAASGYQESFTYDSLGRPLTTTKNQFGETFTTSTTYDVLGRVTSSTDAGGLTVMSEYDEAYSFPLRQKLAPGSYEGAGTTLWQAGTYDSKGRTLTQTLAQGVNISAIYDAAKGDVLALSASRNGSSIQSKTYAWDSLGNLNTRTDLIAQRTETFGYDTLNRLTSSSVVALPGAIITSVPPPQTYSYDIKGNLLTKGDSASVTYASPTRIHAVTSATVKGFNRTYSYDAAGYVTSDGKRTYTWTSFGQLKQLVYESAPELKDLTGFIRYAAGRVQSEFDFDAAGGRARQVKERTAPNDSREIETTLYLGAYERENHTTKSNELASPVLVKTVHRHSLGGGMIYTRTLGGSEPGTKLTNVLKDHLGSTDALVVGTWNGSTFANQSIERLSFDAWGERRDASTQISYRASDTDPFRTSAKDHDRGYTGHEQLDDSGLIHMNGRIYDPELGRFLSPDPVVQIPEYSQNFNRYSYVLNNPLNATDPSGFSFISKAFSKIGSFIKENWRTIVLTVILTALNVPYPIALASASAINTAVSGGSLKDVGIAFVSGFIDGYTGYKLGAYTPIIKTIGTGIVAGTRNYAMGGKFGDGFLNSVKFSMIFEALGSAGRLTSSYFSKENEDGIGDVSHQEHELLYNAGYDAHKMKNLGEVDPAQLNLPPGWKFKMFFRNSEESNLDYAVFINESRNIRVMSMVGTQTMGDWKDNFLQGLGLRSKQYMVAIREAFVQKNIASIDGYSFVLNGHSLGGGLASAASAATGAPAAIFNAAGVNPMTLRYAGYAHQISNLGSNVVHYGVTGEVLSGSEMVLGFFMPRVTAKNYYTYTPRVDSLKNLSPIEWHRPYMTMRSIN